MARWPRKLLRTFTAQSEALAKIKRGGEQTVRVEHVHVYPGGQAIVGAVSNRKVEGGGVDEKENQAYGAHVQRAITAAPGTALLARTRSGTLCQKPAAKGKKRCRLHGGAEGSGAPPGERNGAYRHGLYTQEAIAERKAMRALIRSFREDARAALSEVHARAPDPREEGS
jgi:hypothetical protein